MSRKAVWLLSLLIYLINFDCHHCMSTGIYLMRDDWVLCFIIFVMFVIIQILIFYSILSWATLMWHQKYFVSRQRYIRCKHVKKCLHFNYYFNIMSASCIYSSMKIWLLVHHAGDPSKQFLRCHPASDLIRWRHWTNGIIVRYSLSNLGLRWNLLSRVFFMQYMGLCFSRHCLG